MNTPQLAAVVAAGDPSDSQALAALTALGLRDAERAWRNLRRIAHGLGDGTSDAWYTALERALPKAPQPDRALNALEWLLDGAPNPAELIARILDDAAALDRIMLVFSVSQFLADTLSRNPALAVRLLLAEGWDVPVTEERVLEWSQEAGIDPADSEATLAGLRRFKRHMIARLGVHDVTKVAPLDETLAGMSAYAQRCIHAAYEAAYHEAVARFGIPYDEHTDDPARFVVFGLGKLGGYELNYSSDIDLIFVFSATGETRVTDPDTQESVSNGEFYSRVGERLVKMLTSHEHGGQIFRVDMRLRPMGAKGQLVQSYQAMLEYYESWGRTWERQMLIKARPVAGDLALGQELLRELRPFIYPKYLDLNAIRSVHDLKRTIEARTAQESDPQREVKTGYGGIRDIEFAIQFLQLLHGGRQPDIREGNTLLAIRACREAGMLTRKDSKALSNAYRFLRRIENRLQLWADQQVHLLPENPDACEVFAKGLGYAPAGQQNAWQKFDAEYQRHTHVARGVYQLVLGEAFADQPAQAPIRSLLMAPDPAPDAVAQVLAPYGIRDPKRAWDHLTHLADGPKQAPLTQAERQTFRDLAQPLLQRVAGTPDPDHTLMNLRSCLDAFGTPGAFYSLLVAKPKAIDVFVTLVSFSETLIRILLADPGMLDFLIRDSQLEKPSEPHHIVKGLDRFLEINPDFHTAVRRYKNGEILRIGLRDMLGLAPIGEVTSELTAVADTVIDHLWAHEAAELTMRYGSPEDSAAGALAESAVLAVGKCGGGELSYTSDLDVVFVYSGPGETGGSIDAPITTQEYFLKLASQVSKLASEVSPFGQLYKLDARLRPDGGQGVLALSVEQFVAYYRNRAQPWEHQAMLRLRPMAGNLDLGRAVVAAVHDIIFAPTYWRPALVDEIDTMMKRLQEHGRGKAKGLALKHAQGGIIEVEFLTQMLMLRYGAEHPTIRQPNTVRALHALGDAGLIPNEEADSLIAHYAFLRKLENRLRIMFAVESAVLPTDERGLNQLALRLGMESRAGVPDSEMLLGRVESTFHRVHAIYQRIRAELHS